MTNMDNDTNLLFFCIVQANQSGGSNAMELDAAQKSFAYLKQEGLRVDIFVSDRHKSIAKWIRTSEKDTQHFNDIWHVNKGINKQLRLASKESGCEILKSWLKGVRNHLY